MPDAILALNAGSSSLKFALFELGQRSARLRGAVSGIGTDDPLFEARADGVEVINERWDSADGKPPVERLVTWIEAHLGPDRLIATGHRVVHGGTAFSDPVRIDPEIFAQLERLTPLAPLHQPVSLRPIAALSAFRPDMLQVACFDTAFHHRLTPPASRYAIPRAMEQQGLRRFGFHGLSYESIAASLAARSDTARSERIIVAHLGNGASLCAMQDLQSRDTSMGFTALDGVMMGTRPGSLDPGLILYLLREQGFDADRLEQFLYHECGLLGVSGISADVRELLASDAAPAREALEQFAYSVAGHVAALGTSIGGVDRLVFTGGIGEHAWQVREAICARLGWLGTALNDVANQRSGAIISARSSRIRVEIIPTDEEAVIARHTAGLCLRE